MTTQTAEQFAEILTTGDEGDIWNCSEAAAAMLRSQAAEIERLRSDATVERLVDVVYKHWQDPRNHRPVEIRKDIRAALGEA